jgi:hypothetical protein
MSGCLCPTCLEAAEQEIRDRQDFEMTRVAIAYVADRYRLDDTEAMQHIRLHGINGTGVVQ